MITACHGYIWVNGMSSLTYDACVRFAICVQTLCGKV